MSQVLPSESSPLKVLASIVQELAQQHMRVHEIPTISVAINIGTDTVYSESFGHQDMNKTILASENTVYRVGSISKPFTDIAIMRLAEEGKIDINAPITAYIPNFKPHNPFKTEITLKHLMAHHSGLTREPPHGHYFDNSPDVSLEKTVYSLNETTLIHEPGTAQKYSNAAIAAVGLVLEKVSGMSYFEAMRRIVLDPLGMIHSDFEPSERVKSHLAEGLMYTPDHRLDRNPPQFELGEAPAGSLYTSTKDLNKFAHMILRGGLTEDGKVFIKADTFRQIFSVQFPDSDTKGDSHKFGVGFQIITINGVPCTGHGGAIYGFTCRLIVAPEHRFSVILMTGGDCAMTTVKLISNYIIGKMKEIVEGNPLSFDFSKWSDPSAHLSQQLEGSYIEEGEGITQFGYGDKKFRRRVHIDRRFGHLMMRHDKGYSRLMIDSNITRHVGGSEDKLSTTEDHLLVMDRFTELPNLQLNGHKISFNGVTYIRHVRNPKALENHSIADFEPEPDQFPEFNRFIGEYGPDHVPVFIYERYGRLFVLMEWTMHYPLHPTSDPNIWQLPSQDCFYNDEKCIFSNFQNGVAMTVECTGMTFQRRIADISSDKTFLIDPIRPIDEIREEALNSKPSPEICQAPLTPDLVDITTFAPQFKFDIRYATNNNFMGVPFYKLHKAFGQREAVQDMVKAHDFLAQFGFGLLIFDVYRPWYVTKMFYEATPHHLRHFVAPPSVGSIHNRGGAVDASLFRLDTGEFVTMVSGFDEMTPRAYRDYPGGTTHQRWLQLLLRTAMQKFNFEVYEYEWWHFNYYKQHLYPVMNDTFEELSVTKQ